MDAKGYKAAVGRTRTTCVIEIASAVELFANVCKRSNSTVNVLPVEPKMTMYAQPPPDRDQGDEGAADEAATNPKTALNTRNTSMLALITKFKALPVKDVHVVAKKVLKGKKMTEEEQACSDIELAQWGKTVNIYFATYSSKTAPKPKTKKTSFNTNNSSLHPSATSSKKCKSNSESLTNVRSNPECTPVFDMCNKVYT